MPAWAKDHHIWERAKRKALEDHSEDDDSFYPIVTSIYKKMGGRVGAMDASLDEVVRAKLAEVPARTPLNSLESVFARLQGKLPDDKKDPALDEGQRIEMEHTDDPTKAKKIAKDHLKEHPDYYQRLEAAGLAEKATAAHVGAYTRRDKSGKSVPVREHEDSRAERQAGHYEARIKFHDTQRFSATGSADLAKAHTASVEAYTASDKANTEPAKHGAAFEAHQQAARAHQQHGTGHAKEHLTQAAYHATRVAETSGTAAAHEIAGNAHSEAHMAHRRDPNYGFDTHGNPNDMPLSDAESDYHIAKADEHYAKAQQMNKSKGKFNPAEDRKLDQRMEAQDMLQEMNRERASDVQFNDNRVTASGTSEGARKGWEHRERALEHAHKLSTEADEASARALKSETLEAIRDSHSAARKAHMKAAQAHYDSIEAGNKGVGHGKKAYEHHKQAGFHLEKEREAHKQFIVDKYGYYGEKMKSTDTSSTDSVHCRAQFSADKVSGDEPWAQGRDVTFCYMPKGVHTITAGFRKGSLRLTVLVDEDTASAVQASLEAIRAERPQQRPYGCVEHREHEASVIAKGFGWEEDKGVVITAEPTALGATNVNGKIHWSWSPSFTTDADYAKAVDKDGCLYFPQGVRGSAENPARITGVDFVVGTLTNKPAFRAMPPVHASEGSQAVITEGNGSVTASGTSEGAKKGWETRNEGRGFHGAASISAYNERTQGNESARWEEKDYEAGHTAFRKAAEDLVGEGHFETHAQARDFLDSLHGRHVGDVVGHKKSVLTVPWLGSAIRSHKQHTKGLKSSDAVLTPDSILSRLSDGLASATANARRRALGLPVVKAGAPMGNRNAAGQRGSRANDYEALRKSADRLSSMAKDIGGHELAEDEHKAARDLANEEGRSKETSYHHNKVTFHQRQQEKLRHVMSSDENTADNILARLGRTGRPQPAHQ